METTKRQHIALVIKYIGISFITGGLSHGFFSGQRQIVTALVGVGFFIAGTLIEQEEKDPHYIRTILFGAVLAVAIGALTGGLQHFPDSPDRSLWLVPVGFFISAIAFVLIEKGRDVPKGYIHYITVWSIMFIGISFGFYWLVQGGYVGGLHGTEGHHEISGGEESPISHSIDTIIPSSTQEIEHNDGHGH